MKLDLKPVLAASTFVLGASQAFAATQIGDYLTFSGFGTLGAVQTDTDDAEYMRDGQPTGAKDKIDYNVDSNIGLQLTAQPTHWLSGTVQMLTQERDEPNLSTEVEWAFVKVEPLKGLNVRGGRMALPMFTISDTRNVGYANTWVRPPNEVYGLALLHRLTGGDVSYRLPIGSTSLTISGLAGESFLATGETKVKKIRGINAQWETDWVTVRAGRVQGDIDLIPPSGPPITDRYTFSDIGVIVDRDNIVAQAEYVTRRSKTVGDFVDADGWYVLGGYRVNAVLPYVSYASTKPKSSESPQLLSHEQSTLAAGVRWDAFRSAAIKFQLERVDTNDTAGISFITPTIPVPFGMPIAQPVTRPVTVASLTLDVVF